MGSIRATLEKYPHVGKLLPAMGYFPEQIADLQASVAAVDCDVVLIGTPFDLARSMTLDKPTLRVSYGSEELSGDGKSSRLADRVLGVAR